RGPSGKTWPKCASQRGQETAMRRIPNVLSSIVLTFSFAIGSQKLGHPVPDSNLVSESNSAVPQQAQRKMPLSCRSQYSPVNARSVPSWRAISNACGESCSFHSSSLFLTLGTVAVFWRSPESENSTMVTSSAVLLGCFSEISLCLISKIIVLGISTQERANGLEFREEGCFEELGRPKEQKIFLLGEALVLRNPPIVWISGCLQCCSDAP